MGMRYIHSHSVRALALFVADGVWRMSVIRGLLLCVAGHPPRPLDRKRVAGQGCGAEEKTATVCGEDRGACRPQTDGLAKHRRQDTVRSAGMREGRGGGGPSWRPPPQLQRCDARARGRWSSLSRQRACTGGCGRVDVGGGTRNSAGVARRGGF
eukprot:1077239-Rhodomonas_salina.1